MSFWERAKAVFSRSAARFVRFKEYLPLVAGVALTLTAILIAKHRINAVENEIREKAAPVDVVVASCPIPKGTALSRLNLAKLSVPASGTSRRNVPAGEFELLLGARAKASIEAREPIFWTDVEEPFDIETLSQAIPRGRRAFTIETDLAASFSGLIRPGDRVDISLQDRSGKAAQTWLYDIPVLAVDRHFDRPPDPEAATDTSSITLSVTPAEGIRLVAARGADLRWFLRNPDDHSPPAAALPPWFETRTPVEIWRAGVREPRTQTAALEAAE